MTDRLPKLNAPLLEITQTPRDSYVLVQLQGELDIRGAADLEYRVLPLTTAGTPRIVLDLRGLDFMDSTGLSSLLRIQHAADQAGCRFELQRGNERVQRLLQLSGTIDDFVFIDEQP